MNGHEVEVGIDKIHELQNIAVPITTSTWIRCFEHWSKCSERFIKKNYRWIIYVVLINTIGSVWIHFSNSLIIHEEISKEININQYLAIGGRLQPNIANFHLDFHSKYGWVWEAC